MLVSKIGNTRTLKNDRMRFFFISDFMINNSEITIVLQMTVVSLNRIDFCISCVENILGILGGKRSCQSQEVWRVTYYLCIGFLLLNCDSSTCIFTSNPWGFFSLFLKKVIAYRKSKDSVSHTFVEISLILSIFLLNGAVLERWEFSLEEKSK